MRRRVVGDAGPRVLLGNRLLLPRPLGAFGPVNCRVRGAPVPGDMPVRFKVRPGSAGPKADGGGGGAMAGRVRGVAASLALCAAPLARPLQNLPGWAPARHSPGGCASPLTSSLSARTRSRLTMWPSWMVLRWVGRLRGDGGRAPSRGLQIGTLGAHLPV